MPTPSEVKELIEKFQSTIREWPPEGGLFLDLMKEKLKQIETHFMQEVAAQLPEGTLAKKETPHAVTDQTERDVYVALYQTQGDNMERWQAILSAIGMQGVSRPIYENEKDVIKLIRHKEFPSKEAYAIVRIPNNMVLPSKTKLVDKNNSPLIHVKANAFKLANIVRFVHKSGQYEFKNGHLTKLDMPSPLAAK